MILLFCVYVLLCSILIGCIIGKSKDCPILGCICGLLFGPLGWLMVACASNGKPTCPLCGGYIVEDAKKCKNCGSDLVEKPVLRNTNYCENDHLSDKEKMTKYCIQFKNGKYKFGDYSYDNIDDAVDYAKFIYSFR